MGAGSSGTSVNQELWVLLTIQSVDSDAASPGLVWGGCKGDSLTLFPSSPCGRHHFPPCDSRAWTKTNVEHANGAAFHVQCKLFLTKGTSFQRRRWRHTRFLCGSGRNAEGSLLGSENYWWFTRQQETSMLYMMMVSSSFSTSPWSVIWCWLAFIMTDSTQAAPSRDQPSPAGLGRLSGWSPAFQGCRWRER